MDTYVVYCIKNQSNLFFDIQVLHIKLKSEKKARHYTNEGILSQVVDIVRMDPQAFQKNQKRHFFRDIEIISRGYSNRSRTSPVFFFLKYLNKYDR